MRRAWQIFMIPDTSSVLPGRTTAKGVSEGRLAYDDQAEPEWAERSSTEVEMLSAPTMDLRSVQAACRFCVEVSWEGGTVEGVSGRVEDVLVAAEVRVGLRVPR